MDIEQINEIVKRAEIQKDIANAKTTNFDHFLEAKKLYRTAYIFCVKSKEIDDIQRNLLSSIYKYEELDCKYAYEIKKKDFRQSKVTNAKQKNIVEKILNLYSVENLKNDRYIKWYKYFEHKKNTIDLQAFQSIAKLFLEEDKFREALYYFRRAEELLLKTNISNLPEKFQLSHRKNKHILKVNISQCQVGVFRTEVTKDNLLAKLTIKNLLSGISEAKQLISISEKDKTYEDGIIYMKKWISDLLKSTDLEWSLLLEQNLQNQELVELMQEVDPLKYHSIPKPSGDAVLIEDRFLFCTHGFMTRGKWKLDFTEIVTAKMKHTNILFTIRLWDYGIFVFQFIIPYARNRVVKKFWLEYQRIIDLYGNNLKMCLVAHSFGTYITGSALQRYLLVRFERIIYLGAILDMNFDWDKLMTNGQCEKVLLERSSNDFAVTLGQIYRLLPWIRWIGCAGKRGFDKKYDFIEVVESRSGHSGMINEKNMSGKWFDFLSS